MSLKADWDDVDQHLIDKCDVIAGWKGYQLRGAGRKWTLILADEPGAEPVITGLTLEAIADWLERDGTSAVSILADRPERDADG